MNQIPRRRSVVGSGKKAAPLRAPKPAAEPSSSPVPAPTTDKIGSGGHAYHHVTGNLGDHAEHGDHTPEHPHPPTSGHEGRHDGDHAGGHHPLFHVNGPGGHIAVFDDRIEIHRHGLLHILLEILLYYEGSTELILPIRAITGVSLVEPMVFPGYIRFYFDGSPNYSKDYWTDAMAPNTVLMPYFDHRQFHRLRDFIAAKQAEL